jgi:hypothetical protein
LLSFAEGKRERESSKKKKKHANAEGSTRKHQKQRRTEKKSTYNTRATSKEDIAGGRENTIFFSKERIEGSSRRSCWVQTY